MNRIVTLMHKDIPVVRFVMNSNMRCIKILEVENPTHLPISIQPLNDTADMNWWMKNREVSRKRPRVKQILDSGMADDEQFVPLHYLSVYDCYWIKYDSEDDSVIWDTVALYCQPVQDDVFSMFWDLNGDEEVSRDSPNLTVPSERERFIDQDEESDGYDASLLDRVNSTDKSMMLKDIYGEYIPTEDGVYQVIHNRLYYMTPINAKIPDEEYIPFADVIMYEQRKPENGGIEPEALFFKGLNDFAIPDGVEFISKMIVLDDKYNIPRGLYDMGFVRNADTLESIRMNPIFCFPTR